MAGVTKITSSIVESSKNIIPDYVSGNNFNIPSASLCYFCFESMENCRNARSVLHGFLITLQLQQGDLKTATNTYEKHWNVLLFLESQAPTDMNRYYSEQLCHMECNSTAKLTCLRERKRVAPRLAINFNKMANARKWFQGCLQPSGDAEAGRCCALLAMLLWSHPQAAVTTISS